MLSRAKGIYKNLKEEAKCRQLSFRLSLVELNSILEKSCYYCRSETQKELNIARVDNHRGFNVKNCISACNTCKRMRTNMSHAEFMEHVGRIHNRSNGDDNNTRTIFNSEENVGDITKVLLLCIYDLIEKHNLQKAEVNALFSTVLDEHIEEIDDLEGL